MTSSKSHEMRAAAGLLAPLAILMAGLIVLPVLGTFWTSLFQDVAFLKHKFVGLSNYRFLFQDPGFWNSLRFTLTFILFSVPLEMALGLGFALLLNETIPFRGVLRVSLLIPWAIPMAISARTWELIYNFQYGLANFLLDFLNIQNTPVNWLGTTNSAFCALVLADVWKTAPFVAIILLSGLQSIPKDLYEQAKIDRANFIQRFYYVTFPLIKPVFVVALLFRTIDAVRIFDLIYVLTGGGPGGSTMSVSLYSYQYFLISDFGYGSAVSVALFLIALTLSILYIKIGRFKSALPS